MKNIIVYVLLLICCVQVNGQSSISNTTQESEENVNTSNNLSKINLFNIDLDGKDIPINLVYSHKGIKVNDVKSSLGYSWQIENIGQINKVINDYPDETGWFTQPVLDYSSYSFYDSCLSSCPSSFNTHTPSGDLSPDFFVCRTSSGLNCDFLYKKNYPGNSIPVIVSNDPGYKINTTFANFISNCTPDNNTVFNILDAKGFNYEFMNGPILLDINRGGGGPCRNNFYLKSISDANNTHSVQIEYNTTSLQKTRYYRAGYNAQGTGNYDYDNDIVNSFAMDYYFTDESRLDLKKITSSKAIIDFVYLPDGHLDEINITDVNGKYITGYKFEYDQQVTRLDLLLQIKKYSVDKTHSDIIYQFEYIDDQNAEGLFGFDDTQYEDYFGYCNGVYKDNLFPFAVRLNSTTVKPAGNYFPDINYAKQFSLKKITNKYGGTTEFDYTLNFENHYHFGPTYGGGLLIQSKTQIPLSGTGKYIWYDYQELTGYILLTNSLAYHYVRGYQSGSLNRKFYTQIPELDYVNYFFGAEPNLNSFQPQGNFYKTVIETTWDLADMIGFKSQVVSDYVPNYTGFNLTPMLKKETFYEADSGLIVKTNDYTYGYQTLESVDRATFKTEVRTRSGGTSWFNKKRNAPIPINRVKLSSKTETLYNPDPIEITTAFTYVNNNTSVLRSQSQTESVGAALDTRYYYSTDSSLSGEPNVSSLVSKNIIGEPLLVQLYRGTEKLKEEKVEYANNITTSNLLLPKYKYFKKGTDSSTNLFKRSMSFDLYDDKGNLLQYTPENGIATSIIWGYNKTTPVAELQNVIFSNISPSTVSLIQTKSDEDDDNCNSASCKQEILRALLNSLRGSFPASMVTCWTFDPVIGKTSVTDPRGDVQFYEYDDYNQIKSIRDSNNNILTEIERHFFTQN